MYIVQYSRKTAIQNLEAGTDMVMKTSLLLSLGFVASFTLSGGACQTTEAFYISSARYVEIGSNANLQMEDAPHVVEYCHSVSETLNAIQTGVTANPIQDPEIRSIQRRGLIDPLLEKAELAQPEALGFRNFSITSQICIDLFGEVTR